mmetsp:Transcript_45441/g.69574  ORF Transcript_45441/g.69574 Transcript_45441/m.69574 type:complete len:260 (+) Transcript_45441:192-971(+)
MASAPAASRRCMRETVSSCDSSRRILHVTGMSKFSLSVLTMAHAVSGAFKSAAPMPPDTEKCLGQPILMSMPATSPATTLAAASASSGVLTPICRITFPRSASHVWNTRKCCASFEKYSMVPSRLFSIRTEFAIFRAISSSDQTRSAPYSSDNKRSGRLLTRTMGASTITFLKLIAAEADIMAQSKRRRKTFCLRIDRLQSIFLRIFRGLSLFHCLSLRSPLHLHSHEAVGLGILALVFFLLLSRSGWVLHRFLLLHLL